MAYNSPSQFQRWGDRGLLSLVFTVTSDGSTSAITQKGQILILVLVLAENAMRSCFCLSRSRFHGEIRAVILALVLESLVKTRL